ncbi:MAG: sugar phosphate isomerase/epimerase [Verrucomicrobia bacterium]|nr:sugar phosphate isomerase/epimerase [Verrucomicrobiota bacterium]
MKTVNDWPIGLCSWSLHDDPDIIENVMNHLGLSHLHLAVGALLGPAGDRVRELIANNGWTITSTMIGFRQEDYSSLERIRETGGVGPDADWPHNQQWVSQALEVTARLGCPFLSFHAGFIDHSAAYAQKFYSRMRSVADAARDKGVTLIMETGQEGAQDLRRFLDVMDHPALGINFDPANMILYDKDEPADAVRILGPWIRHVHIKDAVRTKTPGTWGREVPWGDGEVDGAAFLSALKASGFEGALAIEREAGLNRDSDVAKTVERLMG